MGDDITLDAALDGSLHPSTANISLPIRPIWSQIRRTSRKSLTVSRSWEEMKSDIVVKCGRVSAERAIKMTFSLQQSAILRLEVIPLEYAYRTILSSTRGIVGRGAGLIVLVAKVKY